MLKPHFHFIITLYNTFKMKLYSKIVFLLFSNLFISNAQEICNTDYTCCDSPYCGDDMDCFCS